MRLPPTRTGLCVAALAATVAGCGPVAPARDAAQDDRARLDAADVLDAGSTPDAQDSAADAAVPPDAPADAAVECGAPTLVPGATRGHTGAILAREGFDNAPSVMRDGAYRMWWCGLAAGARRVLYAEADALDGPWHAHGSTRVNSFDVALSPTGDASNFDGAAVADPSVVRVGGAYYLYYTGEALVSGSTAVGLATSTDGLTWSRPTAGRAVVTAERATAFAGAQRPSVVHLDGAYYLFYADPTGLASDATGGVYVWRSGDPAFRTGVEELGTHGFAAYAAATHTRRSLLASVSMDAVYSDLLDRFVIAYDAAAGRTSVALFDHALGTRTATLSIAGAWADGPGLVARPDRHAEPSSTCGVLPLDVVRPVGAAGATATWELGHVGLDVATHLGCACADLPGVFDGELVTAPGQPVALVRGGVRLQFALDVGYHFARTLWSLDAAAYARVPYGATLGARADVITVTGAAWEFLLDDGRGWQTDCIDGVTDDESTPRTVSAAVYNSVPRGPDLPCLH